MSAATLSFLTDGRPCLVFVPSADLSELAEFVDRCDRAAVYAGRMPCSAAGTFVTAARHVLALGELVPQAEPEQASSAPRGARWITTNEAAELLGITERAVRKRIQTGALNARQLGGRWLIDIKEIPNAAA